MTPTWWQRGAIYQIYPRSFQDTNGDGIGDLSGILQRLDYCASLGIQAIWLSPIYPSPMADFGYDVSDYTNIHPMFGTLEQFDTLVVESHRRGLKVILDFVPNHTSEQHPWFTESRASRENAKRDWYIWRDPAADGGPPNNWMSHFGGSAWELDRQSGQYYCHSFLKQQPDLNWRHPDVRNAMHEVLRFWMRRGVDGFRVDVLWLLIKDDQFRDNPLNPLHTGGGAPNQSQIPLYTSDRPEVQEVVAGLRRVVDEFPARVLIGEIYLPVERLAAYYGVELSGVHLPFNFQLLTSAWNARGIATLIDRYESILPAGGWPNWVLGNHDNPRIGTRVGIEQARVAAMLLLTLRGTPTLYYGDEIGMINVPIPENRVQDPFERNVPGAGLGRDPCRTPMQWDDSLHAGFSTTEPWLPLSADSAVVNVRAAEVDPISILTLYRRLLQLRNAQPALSVGTYTPVAMTGDLLAYIRRDGDVQFLIALNLGAGAYGLSLDSLGMRGRVVLSTYLDSINPQEGGTIAVRANEGIIVALGDAANQETPAS
jgi:alpha-glucosidase